MIIQQRAGLVLVAIGTAVLITALLSPHSSLQGNSVVGNSVAGIPLQNFFLPVEVTLSIGSFNGTATLTVSQVSPDASAGVNVFSVRVFPKESVEFTVPARGFYQLEFTNATNGVTSIPLSIDEGGVPMDQVYGGLGAALGGGIILFFYYRRQGGRGHV